MSKIYTNFAQVYHEMYQSLFNYTEDYDIYSKYIKQFDCSNIVEIGCGSGNLAQYFVNDKLEYIGMDISKDMIALAKELNNNITFVQGDMRHFDINKKMDCIIITGRSISHMIDNEDVQKTLSSIRGNLKKDGILIFDFFNATKLFRNFQESSVQEVEFKDTHYRVVNENSRNLKTGWTWDWKANYTITKNGEKTNFEDFTTMRAFTKDEMELFLNMDNFDVLDVVERGIATLVTAKKL